MPKAGSRYKRYLYDTSVPMPESTYFYQQSKSKKFCTYSDAIKNNNKSNNQIKDNDCLIQINDNASKLSSSEKKLGKL